MCSAAQYYKQKCGWGCKKQVKKGNTVTQNSAYKKAWNGFEKFFLFFWSLCGESKFLGLNNILQDESSILTNCSAIIQLIAIGLTWIVLKQRRHMSREDAIVEEAAMQGVGLKKRHVFPIALGIIIVTILSMFMVWKKMSWLFLIGANICLFAHFMYLRRKAKRASAGSSGYTKDGGLEIS